MKHVVREWYEKQAHCVSTTRMFCCVTEKSLLTSSLLVTIVIMMLFVWTRPLSEGVGEAVESSQMILLESNQEASLEGSVISFHFERDLRGAQKGQ